MGALPLQPGDTGPAVADLQARLLALGHPLLAGRDAPVGRDAGAAAGAAGCYGTETESAVRAFQRDRGLRADGVCGPQTWAVLVEAGYRLGDRLLYRRAPMLRGDDVGELQRRMGGLGFDAGRVDGIFGDATAAALVEFQRNVALTVDGICGPATVGALRRLGSTQGGAGRGGGSDVVAGVRERERLRHGPRTLVGRRIGLGHGGEMGALANACGRALRDLGAEAVVVAHPDGSQQAHTANASEATAFVSVVLAPGQDGVASAYYRGFRYESPGGRHLAQLLQVHLPPAVGVADLGTRGMAVPILRETRMPAVVCELGPPAAIVEGTASLAAALGQAVAAWAAETWE